MKTKLTYVKHILEGDSDLLKAVLQDMGRRILHHRWLTTIHRYKEEIGMKHLSQLKDLNIEEIKKKVNDVQTRKWEEELSTKSTAEVYYRYKKEIKEESELYDNNFMSTLLFKCRSNTLKLNWRNRFTDGDTSCPMCGEPEETLQHFLMECIVLENVRIEYNVNNVDIKDLLLFSDINENTVKKVKEYINSIWTLRKRRTE